MVVDEPREGALEDWEVSIAKGMLARGHTAQWVSTFFSFPERSVADRRFSQMDQEQRYQNLPVASDDQVQDFIDDYEMSRRMISRALTPQERALLDRVYLAAEELDIFFSEDEQRVLTILLRSLRVTVNTVSAEWTEQEFDHRLMLFLRILVDTTRATLP